MPTCQRSFQPVFNRFNRYPPVNAGGASEPRPRLRTGRSAAFTPLHRSTVHRPSASSISARTLKRPQGRAPGAVAAAPNAGRNPPSPRRALRKNRLAPPRESRSDSRARDEQGSLKILYEEVFSATHNFVAFGLQTLLE